jgi:hypothetical protein
MGSECYPDAHGLAKLSALLGSYVTFLTVDNYLAGVSEKLRREGKANGTGYVEA